MQGQAQQTQVSDANTTASSVTVPTANVTNASANSLRAMLSRGRAQATVYTVNMTRYSAYGTGTTADMALVDGGCNLCLIGNNARLIDTVPHTFADFVGLNRASVTNLPIGTCAMVFRTIEKEVLGIFHRAAYSADNDTILSIGQMAAFGLDVNDQSINVQGGLQRIKTPDGHVIPLTVSDGLAYIPGI